MVVNPWEDSAYIYMDRDIKNLGYKCVYSGCNKHATHEIGVEADSWGDMVLCLCDDDAGHAVKMFFEERYERREDGKPDCMDRPND